MPGRLQSTPSKGRPRPVEPAGDRCRAVRETLPRRPMFMTIDRVFRDLSSARQPKC